MQSIGLAGCDRVRGNGEKKIMKNRPKHNNDPNPLRFD